MIITKIDDSIRTKLQYALQKYLNSISRRNITFVIYAQTDKIANIELIVTGKKGTATKSITLIYSDIDVEWTAYADGYSYSMLSLSEITTICKNFVQNLNTILTKL
jgi:hypothetical protein